MSYSIYSFEFFFHLLKLNDKFEKKNYFLIWKRKGVEISRTKYKTTNNLKFKNCQCLKLREVHLFDFFIYEIIFSFF